MEKIEAIGRKIIVGKPKKILFGILQRIYHSLLKRMFERNRRLEFPGYRKGMRLLCSEQMRKRTTIFYLEKAMGCELTSCPTKSDALLIWGSSFRSMNYGLLRKALKNKLPILIVEDGFIRSTLIGTKMAKLPASPGLSFIVDHLGIYYNDKLGSSIHTILDSTWELTEEELELSRDAMGRIISHHLSKYNIKKPEKIHFNPEGKYKSVSLVIDQNKGDLSVAGARADKCSFERMLQEAIRENDDGLILVKIHPDVILGHHSGYFTGLISKKLAKNIRILSNTVNPMSLVRAVDQVYTVSSQMGFEALMSGKKVYCYGWPFYAGRGLTVDRGVRRERKSRKRNLEEIFYVAYIKCPYYFNPDKNEPCDIFETMGYLVKEREQLAKDGQISE